MKKILLLIFILVFLPISVMFASGSDDAEKSKEKGQPLVFQTTGPAGNDPSDYSEVTLNAEDIAEAKGMKLKIAVLLHTSADFTNSVIAGVKDIAKETGSEIVLVADAEFDANKQKTDIENALILNPDIIITLILDPVSGAAALQPAIEKGVAIALLSNLPQGFVHGKDYVAVVTDDLFGMGKSIAELINQQLSGSGKVALMYHDAAYYVTNQRDRAVKTVLSLEYPDIEIVAEQGIANPSDGEVVASALITRFPDLDAIYAPWATIAEGALAAARANNKPNLKVFTMDLSETVALDMAKDGNMEGIVADLPYDLGTTLAKAAILQKLKKDVPPFVTVSAIKVTKDNLKNSWTQSLRRELPAEIKNELN